MGKLTQERVDELAVACLYRTEELAVVDGVKQVPDGAVLVEAVGTVFAFHPGRLAQHADEIRALLAELPAEFAEGWSFLNGCMTKDGEFWTDLHSAVDALFALGQGIGAVTCPIPRDLWPTLPGGVPYYTVKVEKS